MMRSNERYRTSICNGAVFCSLLLAALGCGQTGHTRNEASSDLGAASSGQSIAVAAAADLRFAMDEIIKEFRQAHPGIEVKVSYGSSGNFHAQIRNRAPFDIYFSADVAYPRQLQQEGLIQKGSLFLYAVGQIVVWAPKSSALDIENRGIEALGDPGVRHIAIANPMHAPYGQAAEAALRSLGLYDKVQGKLVFGENVAQTLQFVQSGAADVGIVALALALAPQVRDAGTYWRVPLDAYPRMEQGGAILAHAANPGGAEEFRDFVLSPRGKDLLRRYGFVLPGE
jgi:molybdate transport system substrate-binding protein